MGQPAGKERKKYLKLGEQEWEHVKTFADDYFRDREKAEKATYNRLFREIGAKYPGIVLQAKTFTKHVASIEELKRRAGVLIQTKDLSKDDRSKLNDVFLKELIGLKLEEFEAISFDQLIQRAHTGNPGLDLTGKNKSTLAYHFHLKELKALARAQRPADEATAPVTVGRRTVQDQEPPDPQRPCPVDDFGYRPGLPHGQDDSDRPQRPPSTAPGVHGSVPSPEAPAARALETRAAQRTLRNLPRKRSRGVFEPSGDSEAEDSGPGLAPQLAEPAQPEAGGSGLGNASCHYSCDALAMISEYPSTKGSESSSAQKPVSGRSELGAELYGMCIIFACLVLALKHFLYFNFALFGRSRRSCL
jgi:hypothetical protein